MRTQDMDLLVKAREMKKKTMRRGRERRIKISMDTRLKVKLKQLREERRK
jgi:hypothetical protein